MTARFLYVEIGIDDDAASPCKIIEAITSGLSAANIHWTTVAGMKDPEIELRRMTEERNAALEALHARKM